MGSGDASVPEKFPHFPRKILAPSFHLPNMSSSSGTFRERLRHTRSTLIRRIRDLEDALAWEEFVRLYRGYVRKFALLGGLNPHDADDVAQDVLFHVSTGIRHFEHRPHMGAFRAWLRRIVRRRIWHLVRRNARIATLGDTFEEEDDFFASLPANIQDPAAELEIKWRHNLVSLALRRLRRRFDPATLQIFILHVFDGWDAGKVARFHRKSRAAVYLAKHRVMPHLKREIEILHRDLPFRIEG